MHQQLRLLRGWLSDIVLAGVREHDLSIWASNNCWSATAPHCCSMLLLLLLLLLLLTLHKVPNNSTTACWVQYSCCVIDNRCCYRQFQNRNITVTGRK